MLIYIIYYLIDSEEKNKVFTSKEEFENFKKNLSEESFLTEEIHNLNSNEKLIINYAEKVLKRLNIYSYKKKKQYIKLSYDYQQYEIFKINEFWNLVCVNSESKELIKIKQSTSLKKLLVQHYEG